ncbi:MAG: hypothetical protein LBH95_09945 [Oscillospiraceae bacterium]|jgi:hypothetical protein|nr:hypothetical protein [Oscillospiraceae bacterium]
MKKRISAAALAAALIFCLAVTALAVNGKVLFGDEGNRENVSFSGFSTLLDVSRQAPGAAKGDAGGEAVQYFRSYAFVEQGKDTLRWKEIKSGDLTIELRWDISKIVRKPGKLILSSASAGDNPAKTVADCENAAAESKTGYAVFTVTGAAPDPAPVGKERITYADGSAYIDIGAGNEWSKDGYNWRSAGGNGPGGEDAAERWCSVALSAGRQTVYVRGRAETDDPDGITIPSLKSVKVSVPAIPKAPKVYVYLSQGLLSARAGMEISNDGKTWAKMTGNTLPLGAVTELPASGAGGRVNIDLNDGQDVCIRNPAGGGKPPSDTFETRIKLRDAGKVGAEHFAAAPNRVLLVDSSVVIEAFIENKWKKVKKISEASIPASGLRVRRAGAKDRLPGPEGLLTLVFRGEVRAIAVTGGES